MRRVVFVGQIHFSIQSSLDPLTVFRESLVRLRDISALILCTLCCGNLVANAINSWTEAKFQLLDTLPHPEKDFISESPYGGGREWNA
jgi:hypothetical protein